VPLRFSRPALALIATGTAAATIGLAGMPAAHADQIRHREWWLRKLGVTAAWPTSQGSGVTVAVLSDGIEASNADLAGAVSAAPALTGAPQATGQYFGEDGTAIASLIAGRGHGAGGSAGILGVAPAAKILSIAVTLPANDPELSQSSVAAAIPDAIAAGIRYAVSHGATVIDLPIDPGQPGSSGTGGAPAAAHGSLEEQEAVSYALAHNVVLVAPAGDDGTASDAANYPAAYDGVIAVGAFNSAFMKAPWSSHQSYVTVTAAGEGVVAATNSGGDQVVNSTSAASAIVAGVAALIRARYPSLSVDQVRTAITSSTVFRPAGGLADGSGYGTVNADKALTAAASLVTAPARRAGSGARPRLAPAAIPAASTESLGSQLLRAAEISGGLLLVLLLLIAVYAATGRRRRAVRQPVVTAQWANRRGQSRYPQAAPADADRMLDVFTAPVPEPERAALASPAGLNPRGRAGDGMFAPVAGRLTSGAAPDPVTPAGGGGDPSGWTSHGPASRAVSRRPVVSGAPPWEPASPPHTELPWTAVAGRHAVGGKPAQAALPGGHENQLLQPEEPAAEERAGQSLFRPDSQSAGQPDLRPAGPPFEDTAAYQPAASWRLDGSPALGGPALGSPVSGGYLSPAAAQRGAAAHSGDFGWDGGRWNPAPAAGPVIPGSVVSRTEPADGERQGWYSQPDPYSESGRYSEPDPYSQPDPYSESGRYGQPDPYSELPSQDYEPDRYAPPQQYSQPDPYSPADWRQRQAWNGVTPGSSQPPSAAANGSAPGSAEQDRPRVGPSGLPIRTPRPAAGAAPLSPSGSLWEPAGSEPSGGEGESQESGGRPIYVWNPTARPSGQGYPPRTD
jgi:subtilisin family serine protease